jgi:hypothetical protein
VSVLPIPVSTQSTVLVQGIPGSFPTSLTIDETTYTLALEEPRPGEFIVNPESGEIIINLIEIPTTATVAVIQEAQTSPTDYLPGPYPDIFYQIPLTGSFSWTVSLEGHPSGSFTFDTYPDLRSRVVELLCEGAEFTAFGVGFRVSSLSFVEKANVPNTLTVSIGLGGRHENYDFDVPYKGSVGVMTQGTEPDPNCVGQTPGSAPATSTKTYTTVQELASKAGNAFSGPTMKVPYKKNSDEFIAGTNFITEAQAQVRIFGGFLYYSNPGGVEFRSLISSAVHTLTPSQIKSDIQVSVPGRKRRVLNVAKTFAHPPLLDTDLYLAVVPEVKQPRSENTNIYPWVKTYDPPFQLEGKFSEDPDTETEDTQANSEYQQPQWKARSPVRKTIVSPPEDPSIPPAGTGTLKDISLTFDNSGTQPKTQKTEVTEDDMPMESIEVSYGFAFLGREMFSGEELVGAAPGCWRKVRETRTTHRYDISDSGPSRNTGYYLGSDTTGEQLTRYLTESSELETTKLDSSDSVEGAMLNGYNFITLPIVAAERYYLEAKRDYYIDIPPPPMEYYKVCLPDGTSEYSYVDDPTWADEFFASSKTSRENTFSAIPHPESDPPDELKQPLTTGKESYNREWITILPSDKTRTDNPKIPMAGMQLQGSKESPQDSFLTSTTGYSSEDAQFANSLAMSESTRSYGRPTTHTRKPPLLEKVEPESADGSGDEADDLTEYYVHSNLNPDVWLPKGSTSSYSDAQFSKGGTLSYPAAKTRTKALTAAQTELTLDNITGGTKESFQIEFNLTMKEGDLLTYSVNEILRHRRILLINREVKIDSRRGTPILLGRNCNISVGIERAAPMQSFRKYPTAPSGSDESKDFKVLFIPDRWPLGEILNPDLPSRRNFNV